MSQNDSKTQNQQEQQNKEREKAQSGTGKEGFVDKNWTDPTGHRHEQRSEEGS